MIPATVVLIAIGILFATGWLQGGVLATFLLGMLLLRSERRREPWRALWPGPVSQPAPHRTPPSPSDPGRRGWR